MQIQRYVLKTFDVGSKSQKRRSIEFLQFSPANLPIIYILIPHVFLKCETVVPSLVFANSDGSQLEYLNFDGINAPGYVSDTYVSLLVVYPTIAATDWLTVNYQVNGKVQHLLQFRCDLGIWKLIDIGNANAAIRARSDSFVPSNTFYIGGAPKSGTTWVENVLNGHPDVFIKGENNFFEWPNSNDISAIVPAHAIYLPLTRTAFPHSAYSTMWGYGRALVSYRNIYALNHFRSFGDRSPGYSRVACEILETDPAAKFIHCSRDPLDVLVSNFFHDANLINDGIDVYGVTHSTKMFMQKTSKSDDGFAVGEMFADVEYMYFLIDQWVEINLLAFRAYQIFPERVHAIFYEDLHGQPDVEIRRLCKFLKVDCDASMLAKLKWSGDFKNKASNNRSRGEEDKRDFYRKGVVGDYRNYLSDTQVESAMNYINDKIGGAFGARYVVHLRS